MKSTCLEATHHDFLAAARRFVSAHIVPRYSSWESKGLVDRDVWIEAGAQGLLGRLGPPEGRTDFRYNVLLSEALIGYRGVGFATQNDIVVPYIDAYGHESMHARWMAGLASGETIGCLAITEPLCGSDISALSTSAVVQGDHYVLNGVKTLITGGCSADLIIVAAVTDATARARGRGLSLLVVDASAAGVKRGPALRKIGLHAQDVATISFENVIVPVTHLLGEEGRGSMYLAANLARERLSIAAAAAAGAEYVLESTLSFCRERRAYGQPLASLQHVRFELAEMATLVDIARTYVDDAIMNYNAGDLSDVVAAKAKWWCTDMQRQIIDRCLQLHGGRGYLHETAVGRAFVDTRMMPIYGGANEVMKELIGRSIGL